MKNRIIGKLGINIEDFNKISTIDVHEKDGDPSPFDGLTLEELLYIREHNYFLR